jgi:YidC/Oxa1 family membrane protein insertase
MDRTAWIVVSLATLGLIGTFFWSMKQNEANLKYRQLQAEYAKQLAQKTPTDSATPSVIPETAQASPDQTLASNVPEQIETLKTNVAELHFSNNRGGLSTIDLLTHKAEQGHSVQLNTPSAPAIGAISATPSNGWDDAGYDLTTDTTAGTATLKRQLANGITVTKTYTLAKQAGLKDDFQVKLAINFKNDGSATFKVPGYFVSAGAAAPIHRSDRITYTQFDWYRDGKYNPIGLNWFDGGKILMFQTSQPKDIYLAPDDTNSQKVLWAAVSDQYFTTILAPIESGGTHVWAKKIQVQSEDGQSALPGIQGALELPEFQLAPGESKSVDFSIFGGPKEFNRLKQLPNDQAEIMNFGWAKWISETLLTIMNTLHAWVGSYALAIIIMTILIRSLLWPIQNAATKSMRRMAQLSPIMTELKVKYKDDPQRMQQETMKLYKEYGINPFGGCLPMMVQIPIFFGFYGMLDKAIELRNSTFLWVSDLSQPDTLFHLGSFPVNILPLVMAGTQLWQMSITPKTGDPAQQRMFMFMPVIFLVFCYNYASALALYWTVQNLFIVVQIYLTRGQMQAPLVKVPATPAVAKRKSYR